MESKSVDSNSIQNAIVQLEQIALQLGQVDPAQWDPSNFVAQLLDLGQNLTRLSRSDEAARSRVQQSFLRLQQWGPLAINSEQTSGQEVGVVDLFERLCVWFDQRLSQSLNERHQLQSKIEDLQVEKTRIESQLAELKRIYLQRDAAREGLSTPSNQSSHSQRSRAIIGKWVQGAMKRIPFVGQIGTASSSTAPLSLDEHAVANLLKNSLDPIASINQLLTHHVASVASIAEAISRLLSDRTGTLLRIAKSSTPCDHKSLAILLNIYQADFQGLTFTSDELERQLDELLATQYRLSYSDKGTFLRLAIKTVSLSTVEAIMAMTKIMIHGRLPTYCVTGILRVASKDPTTYRLWRDRLAPTPLECVQICELDVRCDLVPELNHRQVIDRLTQTVSPSVLSDLQREVLPFYERVSSQSRWLDVRINAATRMDLIEFVAARLKSRQSLSIIRLGDGESYAWQDRVSEERANFREQFWWSKSLSREQRTQIANAMRRAIEEADVLGIPAIFRFARDLHPDIGSIFDEPSTRELLIILRGVTELPERDRWFTEERVHQVCFNLDNVLRLAEQANKIVVVSSLVSEAIEPCFASLKDRVPLETITVPTHSKTSGNAKFASSGERLPDIYPRIDAQVAKAVSPGTLVLVASGSIGKIFCHTAQRAGGVVLDVGAMADYWVGVKSRSVADLV